MVAERVVGRAEATRPVVVQVVAGIDRPRSVTSAITIRIDPQSGEDGIAEHSRPRLEADVAKLIAGERAVIHSQRSAVKDTTPEITRERAIDHCTITTTIAQIRVKHSTETKK